MVEALAKTLRKWRMSLRAVDVSPAVQANWPQQVWSAGYSQATPKRSRRPVTALVTPGALWSRKQGMKRLKPKDISFLRPRRNLSTVILEGAKRPKNLIITANTRSFAALRMTKRCLSLRSLLPLFYHKCHSGGKELALGFIASQSFPLTGLGWFL
jgi:hypothetical protein